MAHVIRSQDQGLHNSVQDTLLTKYWFITRCFFLYFLKAISWLLFAVFLGLLLGWLLSGNKSFDLFSSSDSAHDLPPTEIKTDSTTLATKSLKGAQLGDGRKNAICQDEVNKALRQQSFLFASGSSRLSQSSKKLVKKISAILNSCVDINITIEGHTDNTGGESRNQVLSKLRAESVAKALNQYGVQTNLIKTEGLGSSQPIEKNDTTEGRARNRRIEILVYKKNK